MYILTINLIRLLEHGVAQSILNPACHHLRYLKLLVVGLLVYILHRLNLPHTARGTLTDF